MVITSYTLPWLIKDGIKIWLEGSHTSSTERMQSRDNMSPEEAYEITKKRFDKNKALYKKLYNIVSDDFKNHRCILWGQLKTVKKSKSLFYVITIHLTLDLILFLALIFAHHPLWMPIFIT